MNNELANKYANYVRKKVKQQKTGRLQNSYVDSGRNKVYKSEWATEAKFPECKQSMSEKRLPSSSNVLSSLRLIKHCQQKGCSNNLHWSL